jgi:predicted nucleic acid-binding Zn ribbon protein
MQQTVNCPSCGSPIAGGQKFCGVCGLNLASMPQQKATACPTCGSPISPGQQFCGVCGTNIASVAQQQPQMAQPVQVGAPSVSPATGVAPAINAATEKKGAKQPRKRRILSTAAVIFQIIGWIVLVFGILISLAMAIFAGIGGTMMSTIPGLGATGGIAAIGMAIGGIIISLIYGFGFLAFAEICYAVIDIEKRLS